MKSGECGDEFPKKYRQLIELILKNLRTPYNVFLYSFHINWRSHKEDGKDYTVDVFCDLLIKDQQKLFDEGNLGGMHQDHFLKSKGKKNYKERGCIDAFGSLQECIDRKAKGKTNELMSTWKNYKSKTYRYCGKVGHDEKSVGRRAPTWKRRLSSLTEMWQVYDQPADRSTILLSISKLFKNCMLTHPRMSG